MKKLYLIEKKDGYKLWTENYEVKNDFAIFEVVRKSGEHINFRVSMAQINQIKECSVPETEQERKNKK